MLHDELSRALSVHWEILRSLSDEALLRSRRSWCEGGEVTSCGGEILLYVWRSWKELMSVLNPSDLMLPFCGVNGIRAAESAVGIIAGKNRHRPLSCSTVGNVVDLQLKLVRDLGAPCREALAEYGRIFRRLPIPQRLEVLSHATSCKQAIYVFRIEWASLEWFLNRLQPGILPPHVEGRVSIDIAPICDLIKEAKKVPKPPSVFSPCMA